VQPAHRLPDLEASADPAVLQLLLQRFWAKVVADPRPGGCRYWIGAIADDGYGRFQAGVGVDAPTVAPHIFIWRVRHGPVPVGKNLLHSCDERICVHDEEHLAPGTQADNLQQMVRRGRGGRSRHTSTADIRGWAGRSRAIAAALRDGWDESALAAALAAGDPYQDQLALPLDLHQPDLRLPGRGGLPAQARSRPTSR
jgi:hypothetical protein